MYTPAKLTANAYAALSHRLGLHADTWRGLIGYDRETGEAIANDGSRCYFPASDVILSVSHRIVEDVIVVDFQTSEMSTQVPSWAK